MLDTTAVAGSLTEAAVSAAAADAIAGDARFWVGLSGELVAGSDVATHLEAVLALLEQRGWSRTFNDSDPELPEADESTSVKAVLLGLLRAARDMTVDRGPLTFGDAMHRVTRTAGDSDSWSVGGRVLDALLRAYTGAPAAVYDAWAAKRSRSWGEARDLLVAGAEFARTYGPRA